MPGPHHSTGYLPKVNPHPDLNEPQLHNMPYNVPIPNTRHPRSVYGTHEVSSIHLQTPHPISQVGPDLLSQPLLITQPPPNLYGHGSQSYRSHAQPVDYVPPHRPNPQVNSLASLPPPHYPGNVSYPQQPNVPTNAQFPARDIQYYADGGTQHQLPWSNGYPPTQGNGYPPTRTMVTLPTMIPPQWEGHQNPRYPHSNASEPPDDFDGQRKKEGYYGAPHQNQNPPYRGLHQPHQFKPWDPKLTKYTGKIPWCAYEVKLDLMATKYNWDEATKLAKLVEALEDVALTFSVVYLWRLETAILLFDVNLVPNSVPKKRPKLLKTNLSFFNRRMMRSLRNLLNVPYASPQMHGEMCQQR